MFLIKSILLLYFFAYLGSAQADNLGRLFTSEEDRLELERIKLQKEEPEKKVIEEVVIPEEPVQVETEIINRDEITLKGIVHRSSGKSTAWVNESNTFEGDLESQYIQIPEDEIKPDKVTIIMPDDSTHVDLKVGEAFIPKPIVRDVIKTTDSDVE